MRADELEPRLRELVGRLESVGAHDETLGEFVPSRGIGPFATAQKFRSIGRAWRLGVLLVDRSVRLYSTGELTRAIEPGRAAVNRSPAGEHRRALRLAAARSGFPKGEVVNYGFRPIATSADTVVAGSGSLSVVDGAVVLTLEAGAVTDLERYLAERFTLLVVGA